MTGWKYVAVRINGDGTETILDLDVPIANAQVKRDLSGPSQLTGTISPELQRLQTEVSGVTQPMFVPWSTAIFPEKDGVLRHGYIVADVSEAGSELAIDCVGYAYYPYGMPWTGPEFLGVKVDPLDMVRKIWQHLQSFKRGNLGMVVDSTTSPIRIGNTLELVEFNDVEFEAGPFKLAHYVTHDLGKTIEDLAKRCPFDFRERHEWDAFDDRKINHRLELGYPRIGTRRSDLRFVVGENIFVNPSVNYSGEEYSDEVIVLGSGEGRTMVRSDPVTRDTGRLRRAVVVIKKDCTTKKAANSAALVELKQRLGDADITEIQVTDHPHAAFGTFDLGDEIAVGTTDGWSDGRDLWVRITAITHAPQTDTMTLTVIRADKV